MKKYEVLASYYSSSKKKKKRKRKEEIAKCSIITNSNCGKHKPSNYGRKHKSVLYDITKTEKQRNGKETVLSSVKSRNETLIPKATGSTNAGKKTLAATLQVSHLFLQKLNMDIYGLNGWTDSPHKKGSGNLT